MKNNVLVRVTLLTSSQFEDIPSCIINKYFNEYTDIEFLFIFIHIFIIGGFHVKVRNCIPHTHVVICMANSRTCSFSFIITAAIVSR